jgi:hypothetical protein
MLLKALCHPSTTGRNRCAQALRITAARVDHRAVGLCKRSGAEAGSGYNQDQAFGGDGKVLHKYAPCLARYSDCTSLPIGPGHRGLRAITGSGGAAAGGLAFRACSAYRGAGCGTVYCAAGAVATRPCGRRADVALLATHVARSGVALWAGYRALAITGLRWHAKRQQCANAQSAYPGANFSETAIGAGSLVRVHDQSPFA